MKRQITAGTVALICGLGGYAIAQQAPAGPPVEPTQQKLTQSQCIGLWSQADATHVGYLSKSTAQPYISNFELANKAGDGKLTQSEFMDACARGLVHGSSNTGSSSGTAPEHGTLPNPSGKAPMPDGSAQ